MIREWGVFSDFSCSSEIISSLQTLRILIAFPWHLCTDLLGKHFPPLRDAALLGPGQTQWQSESKSGKGKYTFTLCTFFHRAPPTATEHTPRWWILLISTHPNPILWDLQLFNRVNTTPANPQVWLELLFTQSVLGPATSSHSLLPYSGQLIPTGFLSLEMSPSHTSYTNYCEQKLFNAVLVKMSLWQPLIS